MNHIKSLRLIGKPVHLLFLIVVLSCNANDQKDVLKTITVPAGEVQLFNNKNFTVPIGELQVIKYEVTNTAFRKFVDETHYITTAEKNGESMVFDTADKKWTLKKGADWKHPKGTGSGIEGKEMYPVVHVSYKDACAYCEWVHMRLPYESEWEYIEKTNAGNTENFNSWQGIFPYKDDGKDGYKGTSPVGSYSTTKEECCDLKGNVWEWCMDYYHQGWPEAGPQVEMSKRRTGPDRPYSEQEIFDTLRVIKGGSFLCAENFCEGYKDLKRKSADPGMSYEHIGFRCVK